MKETKMKVLLVGESAKGSSFLFRHLEQHGCQCSYAGSLEEALQLFGLHSFQLILSTRPLPGTCSPVEQLGDSSFNAFYCYPVEDSAWWLPLILHGEKSVGSPALRPNEFLSLLDRLVAGRELERAFAADAN